MKSALFRKIKWLMVLTKNNMKYLNFAKQHKEQVYIIIAIMIAGCALLLSYTLPTFFSSKQQQAYAGSVHSMNTALRQPKPPSVRGYEAGEIIDFNIFLSYTYCGNDGGWPKGQMSRPVPYGTAHTGMTSNLENGVTATQTRFGDGENKYNYTGNFARQFTAPAAAGKYWFKYKVGVYTNQGTSKYTEGVAVFKVLPRDLCANIPGRQPIVTSNYFQTINAQGQPICLEYGDRTLICKASKNPIIPNENVTFTAQTASGQLGDFAWYNGGSTYGAVIKTDTNTAQSNYARSYSAPGTYLVSVLTRIDGAIDKCVMGVTVQGEGEEQVKLDEGNGAFDIDESRIFIDGDEIFYLDPSAGDGVIDFNISAGFTNNTCKMTWDAQNVLKCDLYKNEQFFEKIEKKGELDVSPGIYKIKCLQLKDGAEISSDSLICRKNPNVREV